MVKYWRHITERVKDLFGLDPEKVACVMYQSQTSIFSSLGLNVTAWLRQLF